MNTFGAGIWGLILSILVTFHIIIEFIYYGREYVSAKREKNYLEDIHKYRKLSTKTEKLIQIQKDLTEIKRLLK